MLPQIAVQQMGAVHRGLTAYKVHTFCFVSDTTDLTDSTTRYLPHTIAIVYSLHTCQGSGQLLQ